MLLLADATVTGTWNMGLQGDHVIPTALVLKQDGHEVTGTIALPTQNIGQRVEVKLTGTFADNVLTLSGNVENAKEPTNDRNHRVTWETRARSKARLPFMAGSIPWTAERLKERK